MLAVYSSWWIRGLIVSLLIASVINLGADIGAMGAVLKLLIGGSLAYATGFALLPMVLQV